MHIQHVEVGNFRKLKAARIDFSETTTVFVGANNSGKTSAMVALRRFLVDRSDFSINVSVRPAHLALNRRPSMRKQLGNFTHPRRRQTC
nr:AAA family ATPase [Pseudomonas brassicacearum]